ncbi:MAG: amidase family protein, partial [Leptospirales bacterium]
AQRIRTRAMADFAQAFYEVDAILTPTTGITAPPIGRDALASGESDLEKLTETMRFVVPSNMTGHPAISFPVGYDRSGLPVSMQAIGAHWREATLFRVAAAAEAELDRQKPGFGFGFGLLD